MRSSFAIPTEYGAQKPPTAQWTVTGAGAALLGREGVGPRVSAATIGRIVDLGISDPFNLGGAMAPAAVDTIRAHFRDMAVDASHYDLIVTGDLGKVGYKLANELFLKHNVRIPPEKFIDGGMIIYKTSRCRPGQRLCLFGHRHLRPPAQPHAPGS